MAKKFPLIEISGSYSDVGMAIGRTMKPQIQAEITRRRREINHYEQLLAKTKPYYELTRQLFPQFIEEMTAIAQTADVPAEEYFFINNQEVFDETEEKDRQHASIPDHCTIAVSFNQDGAVVGHNEDAEGEVDQMYLLKATVGNVTFFGLNYATGIPGCAASINSYGLVQCLNWLNQTPKIGIPKFFLARAVLECKSLLQAENLIKQTPRASGFNHVLIQNHEVRNIEIAGEEIAVETTNGPYIHTNHYLSDEMKKYETFHTKSSEARYQRAKELIKPNMTPEDMMALLSDRENQEFPISRPGEAVGSIVFVPTQKSVHVCYGHPVVGEYVSYSSA